MRIGRGASGAAEGSWLVDAPLAGRASATSTGRPEHDASSSATSKATAVFTHPSVDASGPSRNLPESRFRYASSSHSVSHASTVTS